MIFGFFTCIIIYYKRSYNSTTLNFYLIQWPTGSFIFQNNILRTSINYNNYCIVFLLSSPLLLAFIFNSYLIFLIHNIKIKISTFELSNQYNNRSWTNLWFTVYISSKRNISFILKLPNFCKYLKIYYLHDMSLFYDNNLMTYELHKYLPIFLKLNKQLFTY